MDSVLTEAKRLHALGFAIIWVRPKSKRPLETGWTSGERHDWDFLKKTYREGYNVGVRTGTPSKIGKRFLACIDVDIKDKAFKKIALTKLKEITQGREFPTVQSGGGSGSRHLYCVTDAPFKMVTVAKSEETYVENGKKHHKWEICIYSDGRQMVLPPSTHPSGRAYEWRNPVSEKVPRLDLETESLRQVEKKDRVVLEDFAVEPVELAWLDIPDAVCAGILEGTDVTDRSAFLLRASNALFSAGLTRNEVLTVLTDPDTHLGRIGYEHAQTGSRKKAAAWVYRYTYKKVESERTDTSVFSAPIPEARKLSAEERDRQAAEFKKDRAWKQDIVKTQQGFPHKNVQNVVLILSKSEAENVIRRDDFAYRDAYSRSTAWGGRRGEVVSDDDIAKIKYWLGKNFLFEPSSGTISDSLVVLATRNNFDPVKDALEALPRWDGTPRLSEWLSNNFEAQGDPEYLSQVFTKWMVAMVMRVYKPGAKFDWMPIFEGSQGVGKSSFGRLLVGDTYFLDWIPNLADKDAAVSLQGMWAVEMSELSQFRRNELESIKAFLSRTVDKYRPPYGRRLIESPRRCVFFGTTNRQNYLIDETGNRRFKPVVVGRLNFKALKKDRPQLFAEAKHLFQEKIETERTMELTGAAREFERKIHHEKMVEDDSHSMEESMRDFIEKVRQKELNFDLEKFKILDLFGGVGPLGGWRRENKNLQFASKMLKRLGAERRFIKGRKYWKIVISAPTTHPTI